MSKLFKLGVLCASLFYLSGCEKAGDADGSLAYTLTAKNAAASLGSTGTASGSVVAPLSNGSITWTSVNVYIKKISLKAKKDGKEVTIVQENVTSGGDLLTAGSVSGTVALPAGTYTDVKFQFNLAESATNPPFSLKGTYTEVSGTKIPVEVKINQNAEFVTGAETITITSEKYTASVLFELNGLVKGLTASDFGQTTRTNGTILVTTSVNQALLTKLVLNLSNSVGVTLKK